MIFNLLDRYLLLISHFHTIHFREHLLATYRRHSNNNNSSSNGGPSVNIATNPPEIIPVPHHVVPLPTYGDATSSVVTPGVSVNNTFNRAHASVRYIPSEVNFPRKFDLDLEVFILNRGNFPRRTVPFTRGYL